MKKGDRVIHINGSVGYVESVDNDSSYPTIDVRWLTPNNTPSVCIGICRQKDLKLVSDNVIPMQRSNAWWKEAREFCSMIENALYDAEI